MIQQTVMPFKVFRCLRLRIPGKLIEHARRKIFNVATGVEKYKIYLEMRRRTYELLLG